MLPEMQKEEMLFRYVYQGTHVQDSDEDVEEDSKTHDGQHGT